MHIPDGFLSGTVAALTGTVSAGAVAFSCERLRRQHEDRLVPLVGVTAAGIFAAQMVNFPVAAGTSGHLLGGTLAAILLGPWAAPVALTVVLIVQCLLFGDGGVLALGANVFNMAVLGAWAGYCIYAPLRRLIAGPAGVIVGAMFGAWFSAVLAAMACSAELAASGTFAFGPTFNLMTSIHAVIGVGEALITGLALSFLLRVRSDLFAAAAPTARAKISQVLAGGLAVALVIAMFLAPFASTLEDGLDWVAGQLGFAGLKREIITTPLADYLVPGISAPAVATAVAGLIGTLVVFVLALVISRTVQQQGESNDQSAGAPTT